MRDGVRPPRCGLGALLGVSMTRLRCGPTPRLAAGHHLAFSARGSVESRHGAVTYRTGGAYSSPPLSRSASPSGPSLRFHIPLVEPDGRFSRIRLSDKVSCVRPWEAVGEGFQPNQSQRSVEVLVG